MFIDCGNYYKYFINVAVRTGPKVKSASVKNIWHIRMKTSTYACETSTHSSTWPRTLTCMKTSTHASMWACTLARMKTFKHARTDARTREHERRPHTHTHENARKTATHGRGIVGRHHGMTHFLCSGLARPHYIIIGKKELGVMLIILVWVVSRVAIIMLVMEQWWSI